MGQKMVMVVVDDCQNHMGTDMAVGGLKKSWRGFTPYYAHAPFAGVPLVFAKKIRAPTSVTQLLSTLVVLPFS